MERMSTEKKKLGHWSLRFSMIRNRRDRMGSSKEA